MTSPRKHLLLMLGALAVIPAEAAISDTIHPFLGVTRAYDDNLFRLDDRGSGLGGKRSDSFTRTQIGLLFDRPIGRQRLTGQFKESRVKFDHFSQLDYDGKDYLADLEWHIGNHLEGHLGGSYAQTLTSFNDFHTAERNLRKQRREYVDGAWRFHPSYRVRAAASSQKSTYDLPLMQYNNRTEDQVDVGFDYLPPSGSRFGLQASRIKGKYPNRRFLGGEAIDDSYTQDELKANVYWLFSATTQFQMLAGWAERKHNFYTERDTSGLNGRAVMSWSMLRKLKMQASAWREFAAVESNFINNSVNKGASFNTTWEISAKTVATAAVRREKRDFSTLEGRIAAPNLHDKTRNLSLGLTWAPTLSSQVSANVFREVRGGNASTNYRTNGAALSASIQF
ncbi:XrtB/PEP-CTERM-associated polysaccharide biosynthesis outer membrane protein EpsL [Pseudoduganella namucuonensis]|uniref:Exopolysaccharide biosynthesis operon protein EpsL n=1 Tax=Pseudoduganella namucuonensis TaxID=1035707 RepID=A0A1I7I1B8_9BURK|nr:XrtB/PEP-CTERM-associated polysaccharide biosynthesis outer membrane protein EpsL [Pseudoduganella namucuonensis]SFU66752.1 exopolysaccharide biosynthesis operon protein EpsL [Pseudoduganella namucuonensis]